MSWLNCVLQHELGMNRLISLVAHLGSLFIKLWQDYNQAPSKLENNGTSHDYSFRLAEKFSLTGHIISKFHVRMKMDESNDFKYKSCSKAFKVEGVFKNIKLS